MINVTATTVQILDDTSQGPFDGADDTLIGVLNSSGQPLNSLVLSSDTDPFAFDGDGICSGYSPGPPACPYGPTGYEGPNTSFSAISPDDSGGTVNFPNSLSAGSSTYFSLEEPLDPSTVFAGGPTVSEQGGASNPTEHLTTCFSKLPINCATGAFVHQFTDVTVPGRGVPLSFVRTYSSTNAGTDGPLGYGWSFSYGLSLAVDGSGDVTITQEDGSTVTFAPNGSGGYVAPPRVLASLVQNSDGSYTFTRQPSQVQYFFNTSGQLTGEQDRNGYATSLTYTGNLLTKVTDPAGRSLTFAYSGADISSMTDPIGRTWSFAYDTNGNLASTTDPADRTWDFTYDSNHLLLTMTDPAGGVVTNTYDSSQRVISQVDAAGLETTWGYSGDPTSTAGGTTTMTDAHGNVTVYNYANLELTSVIHGAGTSIAATTSYTYDPSTLGVATLTDPDGNVTDNSYDANGNLLNSTDPLGDATSYTYDSLDDLASLVSPLDETTSYIYDQNGNLTSVTDPAGNTTTYTYGNSAQPGDVTSMTDQDSNTTTYTYDSYGDVASESTSPTNGVTDTTSYSYDSDSELVCKVSPDRTAANVACPSPGGAYVLGTTAYTYDGDGELTYVSDPLGDTTTTTYDANGNATSVTAPDGDVTTTSYDADGRVLEVTAGTGSAVASHTTYAYDIAPGSGTCSSAVAGVTYCTTVTDPNGQATTSYFDARDELIEGSRPAGDVTTFSYDLAGNKLTSMNANGTRTTYGYDTDNRLTSVSYSGGSGSSVQYSYDADSHRIQMVDGTGTSTYSYDADGRLLSETDGAGNSTEYGYDGVGNMTSIEYPNGDTVKRTFNGAEELASVTDWNGNTTAFSYDGDGNLVGTTYPNGDTVTSTYNAAGMLSATAVAPTSSAASPLAQLSYTRDPAGQITVETDGGALSDSNDYSYDAQSRVIKASATPYGYDAADNPTSVGETSRTFNSADELVTQSSSSSTTTFAYDKAGDRTEAAVAGGPTETYAYNGAQELSSVSEINTEVATKLAFTREPPSKSTAGSRFALTVSVEDSAGSVVSTSKASIRVALIKGPVGARLQCQTNPVTASSGNAAFSCSVAKAGSGYVLEATSAPLTSATSTTFAIDAAAAAKLAFTREPPSTSRAGSRFPLTVSVEDSSGNLVSSSKASIRVRLVKGPVGASLQCQTNPVTASSGNAAFSCSVAKAGSGYVLEATSASLTSATSTTFAIDAAAALSSQSSPLIQVASPAGLGPVTVSVTAPGGISPRNSGDRFAYLTSKTQRLSPTGASKDPSKGRWRTHKPVPHRAKSRSATSTPMTLASYTYNGDGLRTTLTTSAGTEQFAWNTAGSSPQLLVAGSMSYIYGPKGQVVEQITGSASPVYFFHDALGSTRALLGPTGTVVATYAYSPYGALVSNTGTATTAILFAGSFADTETGLDYMISRYYDQQTAQFLTVDPLVLQTHQPYSYGDDNPVNYIDPFGMSWYNPFSWSSSTWEDIGTGAGIAGLAAGAALLCVATACIGDVAVAAGSTTLAGELALAETAGAVAGDAAIVSAGVGTVADGVQAYRKCSGSNWSGGECYGDLARTVFDAGAFVLGNAIPWDSIWNPIYQTVTSAGGLLYGYLTGTRPAC